MMIFFIFSYKYFNIFITKRKVFEKNVFFFFHFPLVPFLIFISFSNFVIVCNAILETVFDTRYNIIYLNSLYFLIERKSKVSVCCSIFYFILSS